MNGTESRYESRLFPKADEERSRVKVTGTRRGKRSEHLSKTAWRRLRKEYEVLSYVRKPLLISPVFSYVHLNTFKLLPTFRRDFCPYTLLKTRNLEPTICIRVPDDSLNVDECCGSNTIAAKAERLLSIDKQWNPSNITTWETWKRQRGNHKKRKIIKDFDGFKLLYVHRTPSSPYSLDLSLFHLSR